jgi:hypothetical protein
MVGLTLTANNFYVIMSISVVRDTKKRDTGCSVEGITAAKRQVR